MKLVSLEERRSEDARYSPETMLTRLAEEVASGRTKARRCVVIIEHDDEDRTLDVRGSGWSDEDAAGPAVALMEAAKFRLLSGGDE